EALDAVVVELQALDVRDDLLAQLGIGLLLLARALLARDLHLQVAILLFAQLFVGIRDAVEGLQDLRLELGLHGRQRHGVLIIVVIVHVAAGGTVGLAVAAGLVLLVALLGLDR